MSRITQTQIARHLGISRSAVAAVLSNSPASRISPELRERILAAAEKLGYVPNRFAQIMSKGRSGMIGVINFGGYEQLPQVKVTETVSRIAEAGYESIVNNALWFTNRGQPACTQMIQMQVEGVVLVHMPPRFYESFIPRFEEARIPVVCLGGGPVGVSRYLSDKEKGFHLLTRHLIDSGYRRLTLFIGKDLSDDQYSWHAANAKMGFFRALKEKKGVEGDVYLHRFKLGKPTDSDHITYRQGYNGMRKILARETLPEVVLCSNDSWALGALAACAEAGIRVPEQIAITGFENDPISRYGLLPLTTVAHPVTAMVEQGLEVLFKAIRTGKPTPDELIVLPGELVVRQSCGTVQRKHSAQEG